MELAVKAERPSLVHRAAWPMIGAGLISSFLYGLMFGSVASKERTDLLFLPAVLVFFPAMIWSDHLSGKIRLTWSIHWPLAYVAATIALLSLTAHAPISWVKWPLAVAFYCTPLVTGYAIFRAKRKGVDNVTIWPVKFIFLNSSFVFGLIALDKLGLVPGLSDYMSMHHAIGNVPG